MGATQLLPPFDPASSASGEGTRVLPPFQVTGEIVSADGFGAPLRAVTSARTTPGGTLLKRTLQPGMRFVGYRIEDELARGGMGVIYRAVHIGLQRQVALKILTQGSLADEDSRRRFLREARAGASLDHPYVVSVLEAGRHDGIDFIAMPLVEGRSLTAIWGSPDPPRAERLALFCRLCEGVEHAHTRGVIHRDLKPDNVLVTAEGSPRILDFGVAKKLDDDAFASADRSLIGTILYMAPEATSSRRTTDVRCDVYSLGAVLYEGLTGRPPFQGSVQEILHDLHYGLLRPPSAHAAVDPELDALCLRALARDPEERYQSVLELRRDVERYLAGEPVRAFPGTPWHRLRKLVRRRPAEASVVAAAVLLGLAAAGLSWRSTRAAEAQATRAVQSAAAEGWRHLRAGDHQASAAAFAQAEALLGDQRVLRLEGDLRSLVDEDKGPLLSVDRLQRWRAEALERGRRARAEASLGEARASLAARALEDAVRHVEAAGLLGRTPAWRALRDRVSATAASEAAALVERGDEASLTQARSLSAAALRLSPEHAEARATQERAASALAAAAERARQRALARERATRARVLVEQGHQALRARDLTRAGAHFLASLELHVSEEARRGLVATERQRAEQARTSAAHTEAQVAARARTQAEERSREQRRERARRYRLAGERTLAEGRAHFAQRALPEEVRERYWAALENLRLALAISDPAPESKDRRALETLHRQASREFAAVLQAQGQLELSQFVLRIAGLSGTDVAAVALPSDPHLRVVEASAVEARRAFGSQVVFEPGHGLDLVRGWLHQRLAGRAVHVELKILSEVEREGAHPRLFLTGFELRLHDRARKTVSSPLRVRLEKRCYRPAQVDSLGRRRFKSFDRAQGFPRSALDRLARSAQRLVP